MVMSSRSRTSLKEPTQQPLSSPKPAQAGFQEPEQIRGPGLADTLFSVILPLIKHILNSGLQLMHILSLGCNYF
jgi:hypothetical protein